MTEVTGALIMAFAALIIATVIIIYDIYKS